LEQIPLIVEPRSATSSNSAASMSDFFEAFHEAAERQGVEKVRAIGSSYRAACGLTQSRIDHVSRMLEFAEETSLPPRHHKRSGDAR
jgi:hypothetical protein